MDSSRFVGRGLCQECDKIVTPSNGVINPYPDGTWCFLCRECQSKLHKIIEEGVKTELKKLEEKK